MVILTTVVLVTTALHLYNESTHPTLRPPPLQAIFAATVCLAVGGVTLSGDRLEFVTGARRRMLAALMSGDPIRSDLI
jgi:hypothetical protein